jgi:N-acetylneuraminic acid mutarotase
MSTARGWLAGAVFKNTLYALGGFNANAGGAGRGGILALVETFTPTAAAGGTGRPGQMWATRKAAVGEHDCTPNTQGVCASNVCAKCCNQFIPNGTDCDGCVAKFCTPPMLTAREKFGAAVVKGKLLVAGGWGGGHHSRGPIPSEPAHNLASVEVFDLNHQDQGWTNVKSMHTPRAAHCVAALGTLVYSIGGLTDLPDGMQNAVLRSVEVYNTKGGVWIPAASLNTARYYAVASTLKDSNGIEKLYVMGGIGKDHTTILTSVEVYDLATKKWTLIAPMRTARFGHTASTLNGKLYVMGGYDKNWNILNSVEVYDPAAKTWAAAASMTTKRCFAAASTLHGNIYVMGGFDGNNVLSSVEVYDGFNRSGRPKK